MAGTAAALAVPPVLSVEANPLQKSIPSTGERIPCVGLGTWITFNVGNDTVLRDECAEVMRAFFASGGRLIDSSPMYGSAQEVVGYGLAKLGKPPGFFSADKVWTSDADGGPGQIEASRRLWSIPRFDLLQVHNLLSWQDHMTTLKTMKAAGDLRYIGITTSEGRRHEEFARIMEMQRLDFIQITYNIVDRDVEQRILPLARERGIAVIVNRPFQQGALIRRLARKPLPAWVSETGAASWAQFILKFIVSEPSVTCVIPATTRVDHVRENVAAGAGPLPNAAMRARMAAYVRAL
jgi:diketogulonate reductase-like aldo/keto reductase